MQEALNNLKQDDSIMILPADKGPHHSPVLPIPPSTPLLTLCHSTGPPHSTVLAIPVSTPLLSSCYSTVRAILDLFSNLGFICGAVRVWHPWRF